MRLPAPHTFRSVLLPIALTTTALATLTACNAGGRVARPTIRGDVAVADDFDVQLSSLGYAVESEASYDSFQVGVGATFFGEDSEDGRAYGRKLSRAELVVGSVSVEDFDVIEVSGGGRFYFGGHPMVQPFVGVHAVGSYIEEIAGVDPGTQVGLRGGAGVELAVTDSVFFDVAIDYTLPLLAAESDTDPFFGATVESELEGWALRVG
ncbi:MAG: hypothetical protein AAGB93_10815, partial [Planctomycetota bacterium]